MFSDKTKTGDGGNRLAEKKKSRALAGATIEPGHVGTHVPCLVYGHVYAVVPALEPLNINRRGYVGVSDLSMGKTDGGSGQRLQMGATPSSKARVKVSCRKLL